MALMDELQAREGVQAGEVVVCTRRMGRSAGRGSQGQPVKHPPNIQPLFQKRTRGHKEDPMLGPKATC